MSPVTGQLNGKPDNETFEITEHLNRIIIFDTDRMKTTVKKVEEVHISKTRIRRHTHAHTTKRPKKEKTLESDFRHSNLTTRYRAKHGSFEYTLFAKTRVDYHT